MLASEQKRCLFLSHSGADSVAALELKRRILASPLAREAGLRVWLDKDDLLPSGVHWQAQIEKVIETEATAFAVYVGSDGVLNWVENEVRLGLSRATGNEQFIFVPILASEAISSKILPPFARNYQAIRDPLNEEEALATLLKAVTDPKNLTLTPIALIERPFVGLQTMTERDASLFFGREDEIKGLLDIFARRNLAAIVADSGSGKSSLALAGFVPAFRGGRLSASAGDDRAIDERTRHVVVMRPGNDTLEGLKLAVTRAAEDIGRSEQQRSFYRSKIDFSDPSETAYQLQCGLPAERTLTLLVIDQFEEVLIGQSEEQAQAFGCFLAALAERPDFRILITVRQDYFNLMQRFEILYAKLTVDNQASILRLKRISEKGIEEIIRRPLSMAGYATDDPDVSALVTQVTKDMSDRPGDLTLVQSTLDAVWRNRKACGGLMEAYAKVGGVAGALANEAEATRRILNVEEQAHLQGIFVRLIRPGDTAGATRRIALLSEFSAFNLKLVQKLAGPLTEGQERLVPLLFVGDNVEIAHEALITQWGWLQENLQSVWPDLHRLDGLIEKAKTWLAAPIEKKFDHLATGAEREDYSILATQYPDWLSQSERDFVADSQSAFARAKATEAKRAARLKLLTSALAIASLILASALAGLTKFYGDLHRAKDEVVQKSEELDTVNRNLIEANRIANERAQEAEMQTLKAEQRSAILTAGVAGNLSRDGLVDQALLLLIDGARWFTDDTVPNEFLIPLYAALKKKSLIEERIIGTPLKAFDTSAGLFLADTNNNVFKVTGGTSISIPVLKGDPSEQRIVNIAATKSRDKIALIRDDLTIDVLTVSSGSKRRIGQFPKPPQITDAVYDPEEEPKVLKNGIAYRVLSYTLSTDKSGSVLQLMDLSSGLFTEINEPIQNAEYESTSDGNTYAFDLEKKQAFQLVVENGKLGFKSKDPSAMTWQQLKYRTCAPVIDSRTKLAQTVAAAFKDKLFSGNGGRIECEVRGKKMLLTTHMSTSAGEERVDRVTDEDGTSRDVRNEISERTNISLSKNNFSWVGLEASTGAVGLVINRDAIVLGDSGLLLNYRHSTVPSTAAFLGPTKLMIVEGESGKITIHDMTEDPKAFKYLPINQLSSIVGSSRPLERLNFGTCGATIYTKNAMLPNGMKIEIPGEDMSNIEKIVMSSSGPALDIKIPKDTACLQFSSDWKRVILVNYYQDAEIYDFEKVLASKQFSITAQVPRPQWGKLGSAFFVASSNKIVVSDYTNRVIMWSLVGGNWQSQELYRGEYPIEYAEPNGDASLLIVLEQRGQGEVAGKLYSVQARLDWLDLGEDYKWLGATFTVKKEIVVSKHNEWTQIYSLGSLSSLTKLAREALSFECRPDSTDLRDSTCWPSGFTISSGIHINR